MLRPKLTRFQADLALLEICNSDLFFDLHIMESPDPAESRYALSDGGIPAFRQPQTAACRFNALGSSTPQGNRKKVTVPITATVSVIS